MLHPSLYSTSNSTYGAFEKPKPSAYTTSGTFLTKAVEAKELSVSAMGLDAGKTALLVVSEGSELLDLFTQTALPSTTVVTLKYDLTWEAAIEAVRKEVESPGNWHRWKKYDVVAVMDHGSDGHFSLFGDDVISMKGLDFDKLDFSEKPKKHRQESVFGREFGEFGSFCMFLGSLVKSGGRLDLLGCAFAPGEFKKQSAPVSGIITDSRPAGVLDWVLKVAMLGQTEGSTWVVENASRTGNVGEQPKGGGRQGDITVAALSDEGITSDGVDRITFR